MNCIVLYASLSQVHRIRRHLHESGLYADLIRAPQCLAARGCGFALRCDPALASEIRRISAALAIEVRGVFAESTEGYSPLP